MKRQLYCKRKGRGQSQEMTEIRTIKQLFFNKKNGYYDYQHKWENIYGERFSRELKSPRYL